MGSETLYDSVSEASATSIPLIEICTLTNFYLLLFQWPIHFQWPTHLPSLFSVNCSESVIL